MLTDPINIIDKEPGEENNANIRLSCFAHSLQLAIRDGLKDVPYLSKALVKCRKLSKKSYRSTKIADLLEDVDKKLKRSNATRWSSEYLLIKSIFHLGRQGIDDITDIIGDDNLKFTINDFNVLEEAIDILEPFADITTRCQSETTATVSLVVPSIAHAIHHLLQMKGRVLFLVKMVTQLNRSIDIRFSGIVKRLLMKPVSMKILLTILSTSSRRSWTRSFASDGFL